MRLKMCERHWLSTQNPHITRLLLHAHKIMHYMLWTSRQVFHYEVLQRGPNNHWETVLTAENVLYALRQKEPALVDRKCVSL